MPPRATVCPANTFSAQSATSCTACPFGSNSTSSVSQPPTTCICNSGYSTNGQTGAALACTGTKSQYRWPGKPASPGRHADSFQESQKNIAVKCDIACIAGQYAAVGDTSCACTLLVLSPDGGAPRTRSDSRVHRAPLALRVARPSVCQQGYYSGALAAACSACPAFSSSNQGASTCTCRAGYASAGTTGASLVCTGPCRHAQTVATGVLAHTMVVGRFHAG